MERIKNSLFTSRHTFVEQGNLDAQGVPNTFIVRKVKDHEPLVQIDFQKGPMAIEGVNGIANEDAILMVITRLEGWQNSPYACKENEEAIRKFKEGIMWLRARTNNREVRGVLGTNTP